MSALTIPTTSWVLFFGKEKRCSNTSFRFVPLTEPVAPMGLIETAPPNALSEYSYRSPGAFSDAIPAAPLISKPQTLAAD